MSQKYAAAGVNLEAGYESVERIKKHVSKTHNKGVMNSIGGFGGLFDLAKFAYKDPILVSGTDGVGTKLQLAIDLNIHDTIGIDLVAMCVNDILAQGAKPLFFLDYLAVGKNEPARVEAIVSGVAEGCIQSGAALIGGETAEMPGMYDVESYDLAGFAVGIAEREELIDISNVRAGNVIIGLPSTGVHSNGYSLVRKIIKDADIELTNDFIKEVMAPTKIYVKEVSEVMAQFKVNGAVHNTGGGFIENVPRALPEGCGAKIQLGSWPIPNIFTTLREKGNMTEIEMMNIFNMGIGFMLIVDEQDKDDILASFDEAYLIGEVVPGEGVCFE